MHRFALAMLIFCAACTPVQQRESDRAVAAFELPLSAAADRSAFLELLNSEARQSGFHVDAATLDELRINSEVSPITLNATVWRGNGDEEVVASAMDGFDHLGRVWLSFSKGQDVVTLTRFRARLMIRVRQRWPGTLSPPIMSTGAIPLTEDLTRTSSGYRVKPAALAKYQLAPNPAPSSAAR